MKHARKDYDRIQDPAGLIGEDEPVFLLRAKDSLAADTARDWARRARAAGATDDTVSCAYMQADRIQLWGLQHGCKVPDVPPNTCVLCGRSFQEAEELRLHNAEPCEW